MSGSNFCTHNAVIQLTDHYNYKWTKFPITQPYFFVPSIYQTLTVLGWSGTFSCKICNALSHRQCMEVSKATFLLSPESAINLIWHFFYYRTVLFQMSKSNNITGRVAGWDAVTFFLKKSKLNQSEQRLLCMHNIMNLFWFTPEIGQIT